MIYFDPSTRTFNLNLNASFYAFQVDSQERLVHLGWGARPPSASPDEVLAGKMPHLEADLPWSFVVQFRPDEILTFGDTTSYQVTLKASFPALAQPLASGEAPHLPVRDLRLRYTGHEILSEGEPGAQPGLAPQHGLPVKNTAPRQVLRVHLNDPLYPFQVTLCYRLTPEHDILERWLELANLGEQPVTLEACYFASLHLPPGFNQLTYAAGGYAKEFTPQRETLGLGARTLESRSLQTGHGANPFFMLNQPGQAWEETGLVYFGQLAYSGSWQMVFEQLPTQHVRLHAGYNLFDDRLELQPGERHVTPALVLGVSPDGWGGASRRMHAFAQERVLPRPPRPSPYRPVLYNSWEATYFNLSYENQAELARKAAAIGVELFCVDDGWFGGRRHDQAGLGDWVVSPQVFPDGMEQLVAEVHRLGMQFGLWVEPEMVNPDSDLYRQHPDWVLHFPGRPRTTSRNQLILDLGRPEVVDYLFAALDCLVERYSVAFFKWDMNRYATEPGSVAGQAIWRKHVAGVYGLMDRLRSQHPGLDIQSCSGGGGRIDLGILGRTDQVWTSDNTDAFDRIRIQEGFSLAYPARCMEAWVTHATNHITWRAAPLGLRFDVAMRGALGIGSSLNELDQRELDEYARYIAFYKRIRHVIQEGSLYRLQRLEEHGASAIQYVLPDGREAVYSLAVQEAHFAGLRPPARLVGLNSAAFYVALDRYERKKLRASGYELMTLGIPQTELEYPGYSQTFYIRQVE